MRGLLRKLRTAGFLWELVRATKFTSFKMAKPKCSLKI